MADTKEKGEKKAKKESGVSPDIQIARLLVRAIWMQDWTAANPEGTPEARNAAWKEVRAVELDAKVKGYRRALTAMQRAGVEMTLTEKKAAEAEAGEE